MYCYFTVSPFSATQALTAAKLPSMTAESDAFLGDLTQVDATGVLPVMSLVSLLGVLELHIRCVSLAAWAV